jgi:hypothetical protein
MSVVGGRLIDNDPGMTAEGPPPAPPFNPDASMEMLVYEYQMAIATWLFLATSPTPDPDPDSKARRFAFLESFLVHLRNLHEFMRARSAESRQERINPRNRMTYGSVWACDYIDEFGTDVLSEEWLEKVNHHLQHMTVWRQEVPNPGWPVTELLREAHRAMGEFMAKLDTKHQSSLTPWHTTAADLLSRFR